MTTKLSPAWIIFLYPNLGQFFWVAFRIILFFSIQLFSLHLVSFWTASCSTAEHWMRRSSLVCIRVFNLAREKYEWEFVIALKRIQVIPSNREKFCWYWGKIIFTSVQTMMMTMMVLKFMPFHCFFTRIYWRLLTLCSLLLHNSTSIEIAEIIWMKYFEELYSRFTSVISMSI